MAFDLNADMAEWTKFDSVCPTCEAAVVDGKCNCVTDVAQEEQPAAQEAVSEPEQQLFPGKALLQNLPGAPNEKTLDVWRQEFGRIYMMAFDTTDLYIWRPLRFAEYRSLQANKALMENEMKFQEQIVVRCVLWPRLGPEELSMSRAGLISTLFNVIMQGSYFIAPEIALQLVTEL